MDLGCEEVGGDPKLDLPEWRGSDGSYALKRKGYGLLDETIEMMLEKSPSRAPVTQRDANGYTAISLKSF